MIAAAQSALDLFLGDGLLAQRILHSANVDVIRHVICRNGEAARTAAARGLTVVDPDSIIEMTAAPAALSLHFPFRIMPEVLERYRIVYNLHPGYLPWCRGSYTVQWALWDQVPAGATLHVVDASLDTGPIVDQIEVSYAAHETLNAVAQRVVQAERILLDRYWPQICTGIPLASRPQAPGGSSHTRMDAVRLMRQMRDEEHWSCLEPRELLRFLRCWGQAEFACEGGSVLLSCTQPAPN